MYAIENYGPSANPNYHQATDTVGTLDLAYHANATRALVGTLATLANQ